MVSCQRSVHEAIDVDKKHHVAIKVLNPVGFKLFPATTLQKCTVAVKVGRTVVCYLACSRGVLAGVWVVCGDSPKNVLLVVVAVRCSQGAPLPADVKSGQSPMRFEYVRR